MSSSDDPQSPPPPPPPRVPSPTSPPTAGPPPPPPGWAPASASTPTTPIASPGFGAAPTGSPVGPSGSGRGPVGTGWIIGGAVAALVVVAGGVWALTGGDDEDVQVADTVVSSADAPPPDVTVVEVPRPDFTIPDLTLPPSPGGPATTVTTIAVPTGDGVPAATQTPDGLGDDPVMDAFAEACYAGDMQACDDLFNESPVGLGLRDLRRHVRRPSVDRQRPVLRRRVRRLTVDCTLDRAMVRQVACRYVMIRNGDRIIKEGHVGDIPQQVRLIARRPPTSAAARRRGARDRPGRIDGRRRRHRGLVPRHHTAGCR